MRLGRDNEQQYHKATDELIGELAGIRTFCAMLFGWKLKVDGWTDKLNEQQICVQADCIRAINLYSPSSLASRSIHRCLYHKIKCIPRVLVASVAVAVLSIDAEFCALVTPVALVMLSNAVLGSLVVALLSNVVVIDAVVASLVLVRLCIVTSVDAVVASLALVLISGVVVVGVVVGYVDVLKLPAFVVAIVSEDANSKNRVLIYELMRLGRDNE